MSNIPPRDVQERQRKAFELRKYLTASEQAELDRLLWSPAREVRRYKKDPVAFCREVLHFNPVSYQAKVLEDLVKYKRVCFRGAHGAGKTTTAAATILWFIATHEECKIPTTASAWRQLTDFLWPEIHKWALQADWWRVGLQVRPGKELMKLRLELGENRFAFAISSNDEAKIEGAHSEAILYIFDESKAIVPAIWDAAEGALSAGEAYAAAFSTPGENSGRFYDIQTKREKYKAWAVVAAPLETSIAEGRITQEWVDLRKAEWGENTVMFKRRVLGIFATDDADTLISLAQVEAAQQRWHDLMKEYDQYVADGMSHEAAHEIVWGPTIKLGVDPAREGEDKTGWAHRCVPGIYKVNRTSKADLMETTGLLVNELREHSAATANIDVIGLGAGVYDRARELWKTGELRPGQLACPVFPIKVSNATKAMDKTGQLQFNRYRDYLWWNLRELLNAGEIALPPNKTLTEDLVAIKWHTTSSGKIQVEAKEDVKRRIGRSPDVGDAVCMAFAPEAPPYRPLLSLI